MADKHFYKNASLLKFNGTNDSTTMTDLMGHAFTASGTAKLSTTSPQYGSASLTLDGSSYIDTTSTLTDYAFGTGEFTLEASVKCTGATTKKILSLDGTNGYHLEVTAAGLLCLRHNTPGALITALSPTVNTGSWVHVAADKVGNVYYLYIDGVKSATLDYGGALTFGGSGTKFTIGREYWNGGSQHYFTGNIDNVRITQGYARYRGSDYTPADFDELQADIWGFNKHTRKISNPRTVMRATQIRHLGV